MATDHHDLVFEVGAGNFGDHVVTHQILVMKFRGDLNFEFYRDAFGHHPHDAVVMLGGERRLRDQFCVRRPRPGPAVECGIDRSGHRS